MRTLHESIANMITDVSRSDTAHIMVPAVMTPRAKGYDSSAGRRSEEVGRRQCHRGSERTRHDLSQELRRQLTSQVSAALQQAHAACPPSSGLIRQRERQFDREEPPSTSSASSQRRERDAVTELSSQGVARAPLVHQHQPAVAQAQPAQDAAAPCPASAYQRQGVQLQPKQGDDGEDEA